MTRPQELPILSATQFEEGIEKYCFEINIPFNL